MNNLQKSADHKAERFHLANNAKSYLTVLITICGYKVLKRLQLHLSENAVLPVQKKNNKNKKKLFSAHDICTL